MPSHISFHRTIDLEPGEIISVELTRSARIRLIDEPNYRKFQRGRRYRYFGRSRPRQSLALCPEARRRRQWHLLVLSDEPDPGLEAEVTVLVS